MERLDLREQVKRALSRRTFIKGVIAGGAAVSSSSYLFRSRGAAQQPGAEPGAVERLVALRVNGQERRVDAVPQETLAQTLRYKLGLTGTKLGCDRADCGACTVLVDGVAMYSCSLLTHQVRGAEVTTIEGLEAADGTLHPVQRAVIEEGAFQCAFCAPGFIMALTGALTENPARSREELAHAVSGNLCRCTDYPKILNAAERAAAYMRT